ncbi:cyclase family protein [Phytohabitans sp. LJ34]|uniref:cyclase family protein n=1 Tax=Phytohabitans sp. LJ34 TaxID=3452217 RepID=UPI003F8C39F0
MSVAFTLARDLMACRIVDLSCDVTVHEKGPFETRIDVVEAADGARILCERMVGHIVPEAMGRLHADDFPDAAFLRHEMVSASAHAGSHIDAPGHYGPPEDGSRGHINDAPLEAFVGPGVTLDVTGISGWQVELRHIKAAAEASGVADYDGAIVLIHTERDKAISAEVVEELVDRGVRVIGTDADGFDGSFDKIIRRFLATGDRATLWPAHMIGRRRPYYQIERLRNLQALPATGYVVMALPVLIEGATAAWTRAVAFVPADMSTEDRTPE